MILIRGFYLFTLLVIIASCENESVKIIDLNDFVLFDEKNGVLKIKKDKRYMINIVEINSIKNNKQNILLDTSYRIESIENVVSVKEESNYVNTWIGFDNQSNFDEKESYYYETDLGYEDGKAYVDCFLPNVIYDNSKFYILINNFDEQFESDKPSDTLLFNEDFSARIPVAKYRIGKNNIRFIIVESGFEKNKLKTKKIYVSKDFVVARRKR